MFVQKNDQLDERNKPDEPINSSRLSRTPTLTPPGGKAGGAARREVTIQTHGHGKYTRTLGDVILPDDTNVNQELVKDGWCWWHQNMRQVTR